jgi:hypothetical protein
MKVGPYDHFVLPDGAKAPLYILQFDAAGRSASPLTIDHLIAELGAREFTEIYFFSHGWNNTFSDAVGLYKQFFSEYLALRERRFLPDRKDYRPLFIGTHWPSIALVLPWERGPQIASAAKSADDDDEQARAMIGLVLDESLADPFYKLTERESLAGEQAQELGGILRRFYSDVADGSASAPEIDQIVGAWHDLAAASKDSAPDYDAPPGTFADSSAVAPEAAGSIKEVLDPRNALRVTTVLIMKDRAGLVGSVGVANILTRILKASESPVRLIGHSYGCRVMLTAVSAPLGLPRKIDSMLLLQPAVNRYCFAVLTPDLGVRGGFAVVPERVNRPIISTFSRDDAPLRHLFHFAARRLKDLGELRAAASEPSIYAALGGYGAAGMIAGDYRELPLQDVGVPYPRFERLRVLGVDGSGKITGHGDIRNQYVSWALLDQVTH